jgi:hypothetical protein
LTRREKKIERGGVEKNGGKGHAEDKASDVEGKGRERNGCMARGTM